MTLADANIEHLREIQARHTCRLCSLAPDLRSTSVKAPSSSRREGLSASPFCSWRQWDTRSSASLLLACRRLRCCYKTHTDKKTRQMTWLCVIIKTDLCQMTCQFVFIAMSSERILLMAATVNQTSVQYTVEITAVPSQHTPGEYGKVGWPPPDPRHQGSCWSAPLPPSALSEPPREHHAPPPSAPRTRTWQSPLHPTVNDGGRGSVKGFHCRKRR